MNTIFKVGDTVYDYAINGTRQGHVMDINTDKYYAITVIFSANPYQYDLEGKFRDSQTTPSLSFTPYTFVNGGFSQERPKEEFTYIGKEFISEIEGKKFKIKILEAAK